MEQGPEAVEEERQVPEPSSAVESNGSGWRAQWVRSVFMWGAREVGTM